MNNKITIGLDLGTDKCCITYQDDIGRPYIITDNKNYKISSVIGILNNGFLIGNEISKDLIYDIPIITNLKRLIGHKSNNIEAQNIAKYNNWILNDDIDNDLLIIINNKHYKLETLLCSLLIKIKQIIISNIGDNFDMVITIPANFNEGQKNLIFKYCNICNINCKRLVYEPCSAALAYINFCDSDYNNSDLKINLDVDNIILKRIMIFDFGAGTLDLAIVSCSCLIENDKYEWMANIESNIGDNNLGGLDIDIELGKYIDEKYPEFKKMLKTKNESMKFIIEKIKIKLSELYVKHKITTLCLTERYYNHNIVISIQEYFDLLDKYFKQRIINLINQLHTINITKSDIDTILLIGGSCYNPWIINLISTYYSKNINTFNLSISNHLEKYILDIRDIGVSLGATCFDHKLNNCKNSLILTESLPLSIGICSTNNLMCKLLSKNTLIPCSVKKYFTTSEDNQTLIDIKLYQGERENINDNFFLGSFIMDNLEPEPQGKIVIIINIIITTDGLITIEGKIKNTDKFNKKIIINRYNSSIQPNLIESNIKQFEINDSIFISIMQKYYILITMLSKLQYNLLDNISCKTNNEIIHNVFEMFWDELIIVYKLMIQSEKIKLNISQLTKYILYIESKLSFITNTNHIDYINDNIIAFKLDKLNIFIEKNLSHLVSTHQIKISGAEKINITNYDFINNITNNQIIKSNLSYINEIKDLSLMIVDEIDSFNMPNINKLLLLEIIDKYESYIDIINTESKDLQFNDINHTESKDLQFNGKHHLELIQNLTLIISNISDIEYINNIQHILNNLNIDSLTFILDFEMILNKLI